MTCLSAKDIRWPKDLSGGPEATKHTGGLIKAQPMADPKGKDKGLLSQVLALESGDLKSIHGTVGESLIYAGCMLMVDSSAPGVVTDRERMRTCSVSDPDTGKVVSSVITSSDVKDMHGEALLPFGVIEDMLVTLAFTAIISDSEKWVIVSSSASVGESKSFFPFV